MNALHLYQGHDHEMTIQFKELSGLEEMDICQYSGSDHALISRLLDKLVVKIEQSGKQIEFSSLTLSEQDFCLAHFYISHYGQTVPCQSVCSDCAEEFEFTLDLASLRAALEKQAQQFNLNCSVFTSKESGRQFKIPTVADLENINYLNQTDWLRSFLVSGDFDYEELQDEIETAGPLFCQDIVADCPECRRINHIRFDLANYTLQTLRSEKPFLVREIHLIARKYGWPFNEIMGLNREMRRQFATLITADATASH